MTAIAALGSFGGADAVEALKAALHRGRFLGAVGDPSLRAAAAQALRRLGTPAALDVLREASSTGPRGVRAAARSELTRTT